MKSVVLVLFHWINYSAFPVDICVIPDSEGCFSSELKSPIYFFGATSSINLAL